MATIQSGSGYQADPNPQTLTILDDDAFLAHIVTLAPESLNGGSGSWVDSGSTFNPAVVLTDIQSSDNAAASHSAATRSLRAVLGDVSGDHTGGTVGTVTVKLEQRISGFTDDAWDLRAYLGGGTLLIGGPVTLTGTATDSVLTWDITALRSWTIADLNNLETRLTTRQIGGANDGTWFVDRFWVEADINLAPTATSGALTVTEDVAGTGTLAGSDPNADALTFSLVGANGGATLGTVAITDAATGAFSYTPTAQNPTTADTFTFRVADSGGLQSAPATVTVTITPVNDAPVAADDVLTVAEDGSATIDVRLNDSDVDHALSARIPTIEEVSTGVATVHPTSGIITFQPDTDDTGVTGFTYEICDAGGLCDQADVTVTVTPVNDAPQVSSSCSRTTSEDTALAFTATATDPDSDDSKTWSVGSATNGVASVNAATGAVTFTPTANFNGAASFQLTVTDSTAASHSCTVAVTVTAVNDPPVLDAIPAQTVAEDNTLLFTATGSDVDGDTLTYSISSPATSGTASVNGATGAVSYAPNANFNGGDSFVVRVFDGTVGATRSVTVTVTPVNDAPTLTTIAAQTTQEDEAETFAIAFADVDHTDAQLTVSFSAFSDGGSASFTALPSDGTVTYTPALNFPGSAASDVETFTVTVSDGTGSASQTVSVTVNQVNDAPVAGADAVTLAEDVATTFDARGNDVDVEDDLSAATPAVFDSPSAGTVTVNGDGEFVYTPDQNHSGSDEFTYEICDSDGVCAIGTVTVTVTAANDPPVLAPIGGQTVAEEGTLGFTATATDFENHARTFSITAGPTHGTATIGATDGVFSYTPNADYAGSDSVTITVTDAGSPPGTDSETFTITVTPVNDGPVLAAIGAQSVLEEGTLSFTAVGTDVDGDSLTYSTSAATSGTAAINAATGAFTYTPDTDFLGTDSVTITASDGTLSDAETVTITVTAVNDAPTTVDDAYPGTEDTTLTADAATGVLANDGDVEGDSLTAVLVTAPATGSLTLNADGSFSYVPAANANGAVTFTYKANDGASDGNVATVTLTIGAANDAPTATAVGTDTTPDPNNGGDVDVDILDIVEGGSALLEATGSDIDGDSVTYAWTIVSGPPGAVFGDDAAATTTLDLPLITTNAPAPLVVRVTVSDGTLTGTDDVTINLTNENTPPVADAGPNQGVDEGALVTLAGTYTDGDSDPGTYTWTQIGGPAATLSDANVLAPTFTAPSVSGNSDVTLTFELSVDDGWFGVDSDTVTITVNNINQAPVVTAGGPATQAEATVVSLSAAVTDADGDTVTYAWTQTGGPGVTLSSATAQNPTFTAPTLTANVPETLTFSVAVDDGFGGTDSDTVSVSITNVNGAPTANAGTDQTGVTEGSTVSLSGTASDPESSPADTLAYAWSHVSGPMVSFANANLASTTFTAPTLSTNAPQVVTVRLTVTDGHGGSHSDDVTVEVVNVNQAPTANAGADQAVAETTLVSLTGTASDPDADTLTYLWTEVTAVGIVISDATTLTPSFTAPTLTSNVPVTITVELEAFDATTSTTDTVTIVVSNADNSAPDANAGPDQTVSEGVTVTLDGTGSSDPQGDVISYAWSQTDGPAVTLSSASVASPTFTAPTLSSNTPVSLTFSLTVNDGNGVPDADSVTIRVNNVNTDPAITTIGAQTVNEDNVLAFTASATDAEASDTLTFSLGSAATSGTASVGSDGSVSYTPNANFNGADSFTVQVSDGNGGTDTETVSVTVNAVNDLPALSAIAAQTVAEDQVLSLVAVATDPDTGDGVPQTLTYSILTQGVEGTAAIHATTGAITYTTDTADFFGTDSFEVQVSDGTATDTETVSVTIQSVNDAPSFTAGAAQTALEDAAAVTVPGWATGIGPGPSNESGQTVAFVVTNDNNGLFAVQPAVASDGTLTYTLAANANGVATVTVRAQDNGGTANGGTDLSAAQTFTITVTAVNDRPGFNKGTDIALTAGQSCSAALASTGWATAMSAGPADESAQTLTFLVSSNAPGKFSTQPAVDATTGTLSCQVAAGATPATVTVAVRLRDNGGVANGGLDTSLAKTFRIVIS